MKSMEGKEVEGLSYSELGSGCTSGLLGCFGACTTLCCTGHRTIILYHTTKWPEPRMPPVFGLSGHPLAGPTQAGCRCRFRCWSRYCYHCRAFYMLSGSSLCFTFVFATCPLAYPHHHIYLCICICSALTLASSKTKLSLSKVQASAIVACLAIHRKDRYTARIHVKVEKESEWEERIGRMRQWRPNRRYE